MKSYLRSSKSRNTAEQKTTVLHLTTVHPITDVRIYQRECRSIAAHSNYKVMLAGPGDLPSHPECELISLPRPCQTRTLRFLQSQLIAIKVGLKYRPDIMHLHDPELLFYGLIISKVFKQKIIWDAHEDYLALVLGGTKPWIPTRIQVSVANLLSWLLEQVNNSYAGIIGATDHICSLYSNPNTVLVGNEARVSDFQDATPNLSSNQVLFIGAQNDSSLFLEVVKAVSELKSVRLAVAGPRTNERLWAEAEVVLGDRLIGLGYLSPQGLVEAISNSAIGMVTYKFQDYQQTSSPTKFFEFAAAGLPVVGTPIAPVSKLIKASNSGVSTQDFSSKSISNSLRYALSDQNRLEFWSQNAKKWTAQNNRWDESESALLGLYSKLLN